jgi:hypothetical protein
LLRLEDRTTPVVVTWDGGAGTLNWTDAKNWSTDTLPGAADDVTVDPVGFQTIVFTGAATTLQSLVLGDSLRLESGSIAVTGALSVFNGADVDANGGDFSAAGATTVNAGASFFADNGHVVSLPGLTSFTGGTVADSFFQAEDPGSKVLLPNLTTLKGGLSTTVRLRAYNYGRVEAPQVTQIDTGYFEIHAEGGDTVTMTGSVVDLSKLTKSIV